MTEHDTSRPWLNVYPPDYRADLKPSVKNALEHFQAAAASVGEKPGLYYFDQVISYGRMDRMSDALACALRDLGIRHGDRVAFFLQNVPQFVIAQYAVWKLGAVVVPLNPMYRAKDLAYYFTDAGVKALVVQENLYADTAREVAPETGVERVITTSELDFLDKTSSLPAALRYVKKIDNPGTLDFMDLVRKYEGRRPDPVKLSANDLAYLTYTSGTTGPPKGAMNTHGNVVFNSEVYRRCWRLGPEDSILGVAPLFHITGMIAHIGAAAAAAIPLALFYRFDTGTALDMIERWKLTCTAGAITVFIALLNDPAIRDRDLSSLKKAYSGGAPVIPAIVEQFEEITGAYIHNLYGLTESTSPTHLVPLGRRAPIDPQTGALSIGTPIPGHFARIMDLEDPGRELPPGQTGEVAVKGPGIVAGYWNKPDETAHAIRDGWLYTGDVGAMDEQGWFYILDRKKDMIIASGFKVWPREVEDCLYQHPAVKEAAVVGVPDDYRGETVKAFVALREGNEGKVTDKEIIEFCRERLAAYKYPRQVEFVSEIPKTQTGKFLRRALRDR